MRLVVSVMLLCLVLYDSFIKFWLVNTGIYQAIMTFFFPYKEFYITSFGKFSFALIPIVLVWLMYLIIRKEKNNVVHRVSIVLSIITLVLQSGLFVLSKLFA